LIKSNFHIYRVFASVGTLFLFLACANKPTGWSVQDNHSVLLKNHNINSWIETSQKDLADLKPIMSSQIGFYIKQDLRMVERIEPPYESMIDIRESIIEIHNSFDSLYQSMLKASLSVDSLYETTGKAYKKSFISLNKKLQKKINEYGKSKKKLIKGFKKDRKGLLFVADYVKPWENDLYDLQLKREGLNPDIKRFNLILNEIIFSTDRSSYGKRVKNISKKIEKVEGELNKYESFLNKVEKLALKETGSRVVLDYGELKVEIFYRDGKDKYLSQLQQIRNWIESI